MESVTYLTRRGQLEAYFDRTAADAWAKLTSDRPVGRIRATVRAGRDQMRATMLGYLPEDLRGRRILDAGCGTGAFAVEAARRGAEVVAVDLSATLVNLARERIPADIGERGGRIEFLVGDMLDPALGRFDHAVAMDSLIHYEGQDMAAMVGRIAARVDESVVFTFAPRTFLLSLMHLVGRLFPRGNRAPAIEPIAEAKIRRLLERSDALEGWSPERTQRIDSAFYISQAMEVVRR
ncbi:MAG: magnesium protoporphyrin IX methyltransferase [Deltaproteobacteria bacterium]